MKKQETIDVIKWHFPDDQKPFTIFHLKRQNGPELVYMQSLHLQEDNFYTLQEWLNDSLISSIVEIENIDIDGKACTLTKPEEISKSLQTFSRSEIYLLLSAVNRDGAAYNSGKIEKNSDSPSASGLMAKNVANTKGDV